MRLLNILIFIGFLLINISCKNEHNDKENIRKQVPENEKKGTLNKKKKELNKKPSDSITSKNAIDFLIAYGEEHKENKVLLKTRLGNITLQLYDDTPLHRASFIFLTDVGYFNTTCFHRVVPNFIVQGGNSESTKTLRIRNQYQNFTIPPEFRSNRKHKYGALAAARDWEENISKKSNPFEFYIIQGRQGAHHLDGDHTVFGEVISGFDVIDKIVILKAGRDEWPYNDVFIEAKVIK